MALANFRHFKKRYIFRNKVKINTFSLCHKINSGLDLKLIVFGNRKIPVFTVRFKGCWAEKSKGSGWGKKTLALC